jgi:2'-5' RNA ligase
MATLRLFIALDTPPEVRSALAQVRDHLRTSRADVKWEPDEKLHCTLKFLGATDETLVPEIVRQLISISETTPPINVVYRTLGSFPNARDPRVIWIGMDDQAGVIGHLQTRIGNGMSALGYASEDRPFHQHVTLGRVKSRRDIRNLLTMMETVTFESRPVSLNEVAVVRSDLKPGGSVYSILKAIPFIGK